MALLTKGEFSVAVDQQTAFRFLEVPEQLARCIPGCRDLRQLSPRKFAAVLTNKVSFITLSFQVTVEIVKIEPPYVIEARITGTPLGFVGQLAASAGLEVADAGEGCTTIRYTSDVTLTGKLGGLGQSVFRAKSSEVASEFAANVKAAVEENAAAMKTVGWSPDMKPFELQEPTTLPEALALLEPQDEGVRVMGGGTALMLMMKARLFQPSRLVSLHRLNGRLRGVRSNGAGGLSIGALTSLRELERSTLLTASAPVMTRALRTLSNIRIRNVATVGGHLAHGDPHMDLPPILLTLGARIRAASTRGERWIEIADLFVGYYQTAIARDELIIELEISPQPAGVCTSYTKCTTLNADDWPAVGVAVWCSMESSVIREARVVIGAVGERPIRAVGAEALLNGAPVDATVLTRAAQAASEEVEPLADIRGSASYKRDMVRVYVRRALEDALHLRLGKAV